MESRVFAWRGGRKWSFKTPIILLFEVTVLFVSLGLALLLTQFVLSDPGTSHPPSKSKILNSPVFKPIRYIVSFILFVVHQTTAMYRHLSQDVYPAIKEVLHTWWWANVPPSPSVTAAERLRKLSADIDALALEVELSK
jgi:hypothetical protein